MPLNADTYSAVIPTKEVVVKGRVTVLSFRTGIVRNRFVTPAFAEMTVAGCGVGVGYRFPALMLLRAAGSGLLLETEYCYSDIIFSFNN